MALRCPALSKLIHPCFLHERHVLSVSAHKLNLRLWHQPLANLDPPRKFGGSGGGGRATFRDLSKKKEMRMADLPPMPGG